MAIAGIGLVAALLLCLFSWQMAAAMLWFAVLTPVLQHAVTGFRFQTPLFQRARNVLSAGGIKGLIRPVAVGLILFCLLAIVGLLPHFIVATIFAATIACLFHFTVDATLAMQREQELQPTKQFLKQQRIGGIDETSLQRFVAKYSGQNWEEYFEDLFGYDAMRQARSQLASSSSSGKRNRSGYIRDWAIGWCENRIDCIKQARDLKSLKKIEQAALVAEGVSAEQAAEQAEQVAYAFVSDARKNRGELRVQRQQTSNLDPVQAAEQKRQRIKKMLAEAGSGKHKRPLNESLSGPLDLLLGNQVRLLLSVGLLVGCALWARQNGLFDSLSIEDVQQAAGELSEVARSTVAGESQDGGQQLIDAAQDIKDKTARSTTPLNVPLIGSLFFGIGSGLAGAMLLLSSFFRGWKMSLFAIPAALLTWLGPILGVLSLEPESE